MALPVPLLLVVPVAVPVEPLEVVEEPTTNELVGRTVVVTGAGGVRGG